MSSFERVLDSFKDRYQGSKVVEAMTYSLTIGGKRLRPHLLLEVSKSYGVNEEVVLPCALALEMIHTYSLIHDDLPAMDNDDTRRGKKTCHLEFDEATAILAGDGLLTEAFSVIATSTLDALDKVEIIKVLSSCAGVEGMILGQTLDMDFENKEVSWEELKTLHHHKTGKLFAAACIIGAICAKAYDDLALWESIGLELGLAFQVQDDIFDVLKSEEELGKSCSDINNQKSTAVTLLGLDGAKEMAKNTFDSVFKKLNQLQNTDAIISLIQSIEKREY